MGNVAPGTRQRDWLQFLRHRRYWWSTHQSSPVPPFDPAAIPNLSLWLESDVGVTSQHTAVPAAAQTVTVAANIGTFSNSMDGALMPSVGDVVTIGGINYAVGARTSGLIWALTGPDVAVAATFSVTKVRPLVTVWADQSGNGRDMAAAYPTNAANILNASLGTAGGLPVIDGCTAFSGGLVSGGAGAALSLGRNVPQFTWIAVLSKSISVDFGTIVQIQRGAGTNAPVLLRQRSAAQTVELLTRRLSAQATSTFESAATANVRCVLMMDVDFLTTALVRSFRNGALVDSATAAWATGGNTSDVADLSVTVVFGGAQPATCLYELILCYDRVLTDLERATLIAGIGAKYGITVTP